MYFHEDLDFEVEYFDEEDYEEHQQKASAELHRNTILHMEARYNCTYPEFILHAFTSQEKSDLQFWTMAINYLARHNEKIYA